MVDPTVVTPLIAPAATVIAALFAGTMGAWIGARLTLSRFKQERGFDRKVEWYERIVRTMQQIRSITFEIMTTLSKMPERRYSELSERVGVLAREFDDLAAESYIYANDTAKKEVGLRALASMRLKGDIPNQKGGRSTSGFWERQHAEWSEVHRLVSLDLRYELSPKERRTHWLRRFGVGTNSSGLARQHPRPRALLARVRRAVRWPKRLLGESHVPVSQPSSVDTSHDADAALNATHDAAFKTLWTCLEARKQYSERAEGDKVRVVEVAAEAVFRMMDVFTLMNMLENLEQQPGNGAGWKRQMMRRVLGLIVLENCAFFTRKLDESFRCSVDALGGSRAVVALDQLRSDLASFENDYRFKLQRLRNSIVAQHHTSVVGHLETMKDLSKEESRLVGEKVLDWYVRLFQQLAVLADLPKGT